MLGLLVRRLWLVLLLGALAGATAYLMTRGGEETYERTTVFVLRPSARVVDQAIPDAVRGIAADDAQLVATVARVIETDRFLDRAFDKALNRGPIEGYTLGATMVPGSNVIEVSVQGPDEVVLDRLAESYATDATNWVRTVYRAYALDLLEIRAPEDPVSADPFQVSAFAVLIGLLLGVGVVFAEAKARERTSVAPALDLTLVVAAVAAVFIAAFAQPRWLIVLELALVIGYVPIVLSERVGIPISHQTVVLLLVFSLAARRLIGAERHTLPRETVLLAALVVASVASLGLAYDRARAGVELVELIEVALFAVVAVMLIDDARWLRRALWSVVGAAGILGALATFQQFAGLHDYEFFGFSDVEQGDRLLARSEGPIDPNFFGQTMVAGAALALYVGLVSRRLAVRALAFSASLPCLRGV